MFSFFSHQCLVSTHLLTALLHCEERDQLSHAFPLFLFYWSIDDVQYYMFQMYHIVIQNIKNYTPFTVIKNNGYIHCAVQYICSFFIFIFVFYKKIFFWKKKIKEKRKKTKRNLERPKSASFIVYFRKTSLDLNSIAHHFYISLFSQ